MRRFISLATVALLMTTMMVMVIASAALAQQEPIICIAANTQVPPQGDAALATHAIPHACD